MAHYTVHQAKTELSKLVQKALRGEDVVITNRSVPVVRLTVVQRPDRKALLGDLKGRGHISDDFNEPVLDLENYS